MNMHLPSLPQGREAAEGSVIQLDSEGELNKGKLIAELKNQHQTIDTTGSKKVATDSGKLTFKCIYIYIYLCIYIYNELKIKCSNVSM